MHETAQLFKALGDETRLRILNLLARGELCVCDIVGVLDISQPKVSRHLAYLKNSGLVVDRREGAWNYYALVPGRSGVIGSILHWLATSPAEVPRSASDLASLEKRNADAARCPRCASTLGNGEAAEAPVAAS